MLSTIVPSIVGGGGVWVCVEKCCVVGCTEIQELDSNMQYLVYENHSKFIKASETIREVSAFSNVYI